MTSQAPGRAWDIYLWTAAALAFMAVTALLGYGVGMLVGESNGAHELTQALKESAAARQRASGPWTPPLRFFAKAPVGEGADIVLDEITLAARAGVHRHALTFRVAWEPPYVYDGVTDLLRRAREADAVGLFILNLDLNPPMSWLAERPEEGMPASGTGGSMVCVASAVWRQDVADSIGALFDALRASGLEGVVEGVMLSALEEGAWRRPSVSGEPAGADVAGFREWLRVRYGTDEALRRAWGMPDASLAEATIPAPAASGDATPVFFNADEQRSVDYLRYASESVADAIEAVARAVKDAAGPDVQVLVPYGHSFEVLTNASGHLALDRVLGGSVDGLVSPISYYDRGLGGAGGFMGPVNSALARHVQWHLVDDTRTGIQRNPLTGELAALAGGLAQDIQSIHKRNFAYAFAYGLGLMWTDPESDGGLYDRRIWGYLSRMQQSYAARGTEVDAGPPVGHSPQDTPRTPVAVVVDEESRFWQRRDGDLNRLLLREAADNALRSGAACEFVLLKDVLEERVKPASVYIMLNAFRLLPAERERLHTLFSRFGSTAIWLYAPGYMDGRTASEDNVYAAARIRVGRFDGPARAGSVLQVVPPNWSRDEMRFGQPLEWDPLFYIDDPQADVLATYAESGAASVAMATLDEGWTSVLVAEPALPALLLRVLLDILEQHLYLETTEDTVDDIIVAGPNFLGVHAAAKGEKTIRLPWPCDVSEALDSQNVWQQRQSFSLPMREGETRLFELAPLRVQESGGG